MNFKERASGLKRIALKFVKTGWNVYFIFLVVFTIVTTIISVIMIADMLIYDFKAFLGFLLSVIILVIVALIAKVFVKEEYNS